MTPGPQVSLVVSVPLMVLPPGRWMPAGSWAGGLAAGSWGGSGMSAGEGVALAVATGAVTLIMGGGCVLGSSYLAGRAIKSAQWEGRGDMIEWEPPTKRVASEVVCEDQIAAARIEEAALEIDDADVEEAQWYDGGGEFEKSSGPRFWNGVEMKNKGNCERATERIIEAAGESNGFVLLAATERKELGVTAAVNIAICLAQKGRKCLLVDMDIERSAVSRVFDVHGIEAGVVKTCIGNLWVQRGVERQVRWDEEYDCVLLYSPDKNCWPDDDVLKVDVVAALLFGMGDESEEMLRFKEKLMASQVDILEPEFAAKV